MSESPFDRTLEYPREGMRRETLAAMADVPLRGPLNDISLTVLNVPAAAAPLPPIAATSARLPVVYFLAPDQTPTASAVRRALPPEVLTLCVEALSLEPEAIEAAIGALDACLPASSPRKARNVEAMVALGESADFQTHDTFFNIGRTGHAHEGAYLRSTLECLQVFRAEIDETPTTLSGTELSAIVAGLYAMLASALELAIDPPPGVILPRSEPLFEDYAPRRFLRGHQIFAALTQGLIFATEALHEASERGAVVERAAAADQMIVTMRACGATLKFAGDFPSEFYEELVRPSMALPFQPKGFSGLLSADHCHLVRRMKANRASMERLRDEDPSRHAGVVGALAGVYDNHKFVCGRFVGAEKPSLLMNSDMGRSSVDQLERFKTTRIRQLG